MNEARGAEDPSELRLFLEEICCNLCRFQYLTHHGVAPEDVRIDEEFFLGAEGAFADIRVAPPRSAPYFVEVKYGYPGDRIVESFRRKYGEETPGNRNHAKVVLVIDRAGRRDWDELQAKLRDVVRPGLHLEVWDETRLKLLLHEAFGVSIESMSPDALLDVRAAIDRAKGTYAFPGDASDDALGAALLWHFGFWRLRELHNRVHSKRAILPPGQYGDVAVLCADICSFSSYVRDTSDERVIRSSLTTFYSKSRYQIINQGGMLYQFLGDGVIALFGLPDRSERYVEAALDCARGLAEIGTSVSNKWQREIDRVQTSRGVHIGMAMGDLGIMSLRPFSRSHTGAIGDCINMAARLSGEAGPSEVVVSNTFFQHLPVAEQVAFSELQPVEARNVGRVRAWKLQLQSQPRFERS
jgi:adenylate cyclase